MKTNMKLEVGKEGCTLSLQFMGLIILTSLGISQLELNQWALVLWKRMQCYTSDS